MLFVLIAVGTLVVAGIAATALSIAATVIVVAASGWESTGGEDEGLALGFLLISSLTFSTVGCALWLTALRWASWRVGWPGTWLMTPISVIVLLPVSLSGLALLASKVEAPELIVILLAALAFTVGLGCVVGGVFGNRRSVAYAILGVIPTLVWLGQLIRVAILG